MNNAPSARKTDPWFAVSMGLLGIIIGYTLANARGGIFKSPTPSIERPTVAQAPSQPLPPGPLPPPPAAAAVPPIDPKEHIRGDLSKASVAVIEYSDFECPFCKRVHPTFEQIMSTYGDKVVWVYRHFPLGFHANAAKEAEATDCIAELGGNDVTWKFIDGIFEKTTSGGTGFPLDQLAPLAGQVGVDAAKFQTCLDSGKFAQHVQADMAGGSAAGVSGTPGNIVYNLKTKKSQELSGAVPISAFQAAIDAMLQ